VPKQWVVVIRTSATPVLLALTALATLVVVLTAPTAGAADSPAPFPSAGLLVFSDEGSLYSVAPDGSRLQSLGELGAYTPRWSPGGTQIAYALAETAQIGVSRSDGSAARHLTRPTQGARDAAPAWSPRGDRLVFHRLMPKRPGTPARSGLRTIRADGTGSRWLSAEAKLEAPDWSPDGKTIAGDRGGERGRLWVVDADGSDPRRLGPPRLVGQQPRWSPDGGRVAFVDVHAGAVRVLDVRRGRVRTVFHPEPETYAVEFVGWGHAWSPDGRWLAVQWTNAVECVDDPTTEWCERAELWIVSVSDARQKLIYSGPLRSTGNGLDWRRSS
jgi:TolB protein